MALGRLCLRQKWVPGILLGDKARQERKADNLTAICEPIFLVGASMSQTPMGLYGQLQG
jgi:hypothetical protein